MNLSSSSMKILRDQLNADGFNFGANFGEVAGAGIKEHLHMHVVPRWIGDTNFMPVMGHTKVMIDGLKETRKQLSKAFLNLGMVYLNLKEYEKAIKFFDQSLTYDKKLTSVFYYLGECYKNINDINKALSYYAVSNHKKTNSKILECYFILNKKKEYQKWIVRF